MPRAQGKKVRSVERQRARTVFLDSLRSNGLVIRACAAAGISHETARRWRLADPDFAAAWQSALDEATDALEAEAYRRGVEGVDEPVFGRVARDEDGQIGTIKRYSDTVLLRLLSARAPERWRPNYQPPPDPATEKKLVIEVVYVRAPLPPDPTPHLIDVTPDEARHAD